MSRQGSGYGTRRFQTMANRTGFSEQVVNQGDVALDELECVADIGLLFGSEGVSHFTRPKPTSAETAPAHPHAQIDDRGAETAIGRTARQECHVRRQSAHSDKVHRDPFQFDRDAADGLHFWARRNPAQSFPGPTERDDMGDSRVPGDTFDERR